MSSITTTRSIAIVKQAPKKLELSYGQLEELAKKAMEGKGHIAEGVDYWDFIEKNRWGLSTVLGDKNNILHGSFGVTHNARYFAYLCKSCEGIFCLPFESNECIFCGHKEMEKDRKRVAMGTQGRTGVLDGVHPELYAAAVKDIQEHGQTSNEPAYDLDWKYLEDNI
jgi:hypothetical protein